jgi:hypothetical protein
MPHNDFVRPDGQWPLETVPTPGDARALDVAQYQAVNGDAGGTWSPATAISLGGRGLALTGGLHQIAGGVRTQERGRVVLGHSDFPTFKTAASRVLTVPLLDYGLYSFPDQVPAPSMVQLARSLSPPGTIFSSSSLQSAVFPIDKRYMHNGATLASALIAIAIGQSHAVVPATQPQALVLRDDFIVGSACFPFVAGANYSLQEYVVPPTPNGYFYSVTTGGTAGAAPGSWPTTYGTTINSGPVMFTCDGPTWSGAYASFADPHGWAPTASAQAGRLIQPSPATGQFFVCTETGTTGTTQPTWPTAYLSEVSDNTTTWQNLGSMLPILSGQMGAGSAAAYFNGGVAQSFSLAAVTGGPSLIDTTKFSYALLVVDENGTNAFLPSLNILIAAQLTYTGIADMRFE